MAEKSLEDWRPVDESTSPMEEVVLFRKHLMLGRASRFQCKFDESLTHLQESRNIASKRKDLIFDEELGDLACDLADTLRELDDPTSAEQHIRAEIMRRGQNVEDTAGCMLRLSLAEVLFAQNHFDKAEQVCLEVQSHPSLLKLARLRLYITLAKLRHVNSDDEGANSYWAQAMAAVRKFRHETCATEVIVISVCDILGRQRVSTDPIFHSSMKTMTQLHQITKPGGYQCWIPGLRHWREHLRPQDGPLRNHL